MSILKNSTIVITGVIISNLLAYLYHFIAGRMLGPHDYGVFGALMAIFSLASFPITALGYSVTKYTSRFHSEGQFWKIAFLRRKIQNAVLVFSAIMLVTIILFSQVIANYLKIESNVSVIVVAITVVFVLLMPVNRGVLQGMKKFRIYTWNVIIEAFLRVALLAVFLYSGFGVNGAIIAYGLGFFIAFLLVFPFIKETKETFSNAELLSINPIYRFIFQVLLANIILQLIINLPSVFIKHFYSSEFTGYWTAALNIARVSLFVTGSISLVMFPEISRENDHKNKMKIFYRSAILVLLVSSSAGFVLYLLPEFIIKNLYGGSYLGAVPILQWMGFAMIFIGLLQLRVDYFLAKLE